MADAFETYTTMDGDMVDLIAFNRFGDSSATTAIYDANPGLAALGAKLPGGLTIRIPIPTVRDRQTLPRLWS